MLLENKLKKLENNAKYIENSEYIDCKNELDEIYVQKINGMRIRSKCDYMNMVKSLQKFFLILKDLDLTKHNLKYCKR